MDSKNSALPRRRRGRPTDRTYDLVAGSRFESWLIESIDGAIVTVRCDCGEVFTRSISTVANRIARRPATKHPLYCIANRCGLADAALFLRSLRRTAAVRGIAVEITVADMLRLRIGKLCEYCAGALPARGGGLDRKDNGLCYTSENLVPCCASCNTAKGSIWTYKEFKAAMAVRLARVGPGNAWPPHAPKRSWPLPSAPYPESRGQEVSTSATG